MSAASVLCRYQVGGIRVARSAIPPCGLRPTSPSLAIVVADGPRWDLRLRRVSTALAIG